MAIAAPVITLPSSGADYATDTTPQTLSGTTSTDTKEIRVNDSLAGVSYTPGEAVWSWTGNLTLGANNISVVAIEVVTLTQSSPATITITLVNRDDFITVSQPTGVRAREYQNQIEIINAQNPESNTIGYNYWVSLQSGGDLGTYVKINKQLINDYTSYEDEVTELNRSVDTAGNIRVTTITDEVNRVYYYSQYFTQIRYQELVEEGRLSSAAFTDTTPFYFVVTAVIYDPILGQVTESPNSIEMEASPLTITTGIRDLPQRSQTDVILTFSQEMLVNNAGVDTKPGTVLRDIVNPISEEFARMYIIQNFMSRSLSVSGLLDFDDADGDTISDPVEDSIPKQSLQLALNLSDPDDLQEVIDDQFDKLASDVNETRKAATAAIGQVLFYIETPPVRSMTILEGSIVTSVGDLDQGIPSQNYQTLTTKILEYANRDDYYNTLTGRYEITVDVQALNTGEDGNTDSYTIKTISSGADSDFSVENPAPISFGRDEESNYELATRIMLAFFADTGTEGGYAKTAANVSGVRRVRVEKAGDPLMMRDYDNIRNKHVGGKVDVYIQGSQNQQVNDQIAFSYESIGATLGAQEGEVFTIINAQAYQFKSTNSRVTAHTPIFDVTRVYNATRAAEYDISNYQIIGDGDTIDIDETKPTNAAIGLAISDVIRVDYKFRSSDTFILEHQPVNEIISVIGQLSGTLTTDNYDLVKLEDTLQDGNSTIASDGIRIKFANNLPVTGFQTITDESHVMILSQEEDLDFVGADPESIIVKNSDKTIKYVVNVDYRIISGTDTEPTALLLIESGSIVNGQEVLVSYNAIENFTVTYTTNAILEEVQEDIDDLKHACADAVAKNAVENEVDMAITVVPKSGVTNNSSLTSKINTAVGNFIDQLPIGKSLTQSDVDHVIRSIDDVDYVVLPFTRMVKANGSFIVRDFVGETQWEVYNEGVTTAYVTTAQVLTYNTIDKGGDENLFRGIFEDSLPLVLQDDPLDVAGGAGRGYIQSDGKIVVSTKDGQLPDTKSYEVAYYVSGETGSEDINVASIEHLKVGTFTITFDDPRGESPVL